MILLLILKDNVNSIDSTVGTKEVILRGGPNQLMEGKVIEKLARLTPSDFFI